MKKIIVWVVVFAIVGGGLLLTEAGDTVTATKSYNEAVSSYNQYAEAYNSAVSQCSIDNIEGLPDRLEFINEESEALIDNIRVLIGPNSKEQIMEDTKTVRGITGQVRNAAQIVRQITAPEGNWVMGKLSSVDTIGGIQAVTVQQNPDGLLGKEGGYSACIYFTVSDIDSTNVPGNSIVEKGTDAGGAVEIYPTLEDAQNRCAYLAGFDDTILYSGSYAIVGTMVIRTSYQLTNERQMALTSAIAAALTSI